MDGSVVRLEHPILPQKKKPQVNKKPLKNKHLHKMRKEHAPDTIPIQPPRILTPEEYAKNKLAVAATIRKKCKKPRFYKNELRYKSAYMYKDVYGLSKVCTMCHRDLGLGAFDWAGDAREVKRARRSYCRFCKKKANKIYYLKRKKRLEDDNLREICTGTEVQAAEKERVKEG